MWDFGTFHILAKPALIVHADAVESAVLILVYIYTKCMQAAKALVSLHIYTGYHEPSFLETVISTKIKCAGSFDLFFALLVIIYLAWFELCKWLEGCNFVTMRIFPFDILNTNKTKFHC